MTDLHQRNGDTKESIDYVLLILVLLLVVFGLVVLYSTSAYNGRVKFADPAYYLRKQFFATSIGLFSMYLVSCIGLSEASELMPGSIWNCADAVHSRVVCRTGI